MGEFDSIWFDQVTAYVHLVVSFQVLPQVLELSNKVDYVQGRIPFSPLSLHLESAIKHLDDIADYSIFIEKLDFSDVGLKSALKMNDTVEVENTENLTDVQYKGHTSENSSNEDIKTRDCLASSAKVSIEDVSEAHKYIQHNIVEHISAKVFIDYKTYIGVPRCATRLTDNATVCDSANSRGLKINRQFEVVELFHVWQTRSVVESNINV
jgi:hypothetical protein